MLVIPSDPEEQQQQQQQQDTMTNPIFQFSSVHLLRASDPEEQQPSDPDNDKPQFSSVVSSERLSGAAAEAAEYNGRPYQSVQLSSVQFSCLEPPTEGRKKPPQGSSRGRNIGFT